MTLSEYRQRMIRRLLAATADLAEPLWGAGFRLAEFFARTPIPALKVGGGKVVLVLAPHPDDETAGCAGTIGLHKRAGDMVGVLAVTDGRLAASMMSPERLAEQRQQEAKCAMAALQVDWLEWAGLEEGSFWVSPFVERLKALLDKVRPDIIYTTSRLDFHPDHHRTAYGLTQVLVESEQSPIIRVYPVHVPLTAVLTNRAANVTAEEAAVRAALGCYQSQWFHLGRTLRMRRYAARHYKKGRYCEPFWEMTAEAFCGLHGETADFDRDGKHWPLTDFWGMRYFSFQDSRAYWRGRSRRRNWGKIAERINRVG